MLDYHIKDGRKLAGWLLKPGNSDIRDLYVAHVKSLNAPNVYDFADSLNAEQAARWDAIMAEMHDGYTGSAWGWVVAYAYRVAVGKEALADAD